MQDWPSVPRSLILNSFLLPFLLLSNYHSPIYFEGISSGVGLGRTANGSVGSTEFDLVSLSVTFGDNGLLDALTKSASICLVTIHANDLIVSGGRLDESGGEDRDENEHGYPILRQVECQCQRSGL